MLDFDDCPDTLSDADFDRIASFIMSACGICLPPAKKVMVEGRLRRRARRIGVDRLADYVRLVFDSDGSENEVIGLINTLTTNKTDFFREPAHFTFLARTILPELARMGHEAKLWSAACSIGAEPYTMAMVCNDFALGWPGFHFSILGSDISTEVLSTAARAIYPEEMIEPVPLPMRQRYVLRATDPSRKVVRMAPETRAPVRFARINLVDGSYAADRGMDVIFCRNLLIYFDRPTQDMVVRQLCAHLRPGGYLILGHTDSISGMAAPVQPCGNSIFRRI